MKLVNGGLGVEHKSPGSQSVLWSVISVTDIFCCLSLGSPDGGAWNKNMGTESWYGKWSYKGQVSGVKEKGEEPVKCVLLSWLPCLQLGFNPPGDLVRNHLESTSEFSRWNIGWLEHLSTYLLSSICWGLTSSTLIPSPSQAAPLCGLSSLPTIWR